MLVMTSDTVLKGSEVELKEKEVYNSHGTMFAFTGFYNSAKRKLVQGGSDEQGRDAMVFNVSVVTPG